eukprot:scaffold109074_cov66-Phaeocystis_antarctica.AAC.1
MVALIASGWAFSRWPSRPSKSIFAVLWSLLRPANSPLCTCSAPLSREIDLKSSHARSSSPICSEPSPPLIQSYAGPVVPSRVTSLADGVCFTVARSGFRFLLLLLLLSLIGGVFTGLPRPPPPPGVTVAAARSAWKAQVARSSAGLQLQTRRVDRRCPARSRVAGRMRRTHLVAGSHLVADAGPVGSSVGNPVGSRVAHRLAGNLPGGNRAGRSPASRASRSGAKLSKYGGEMGSLWESISCDCLGSAACQGTRAKETKELQLVESSHITHQPRA